MKIAIVGSRDFPNKKKVETYVSMLNTRYPGGVTVVSGGAKGVDTWAEKAAKLAGIPTQIIPAEWDKYGKSAGFLRNGLIVEEAERVVAFWDGDSRGTLDTIRKATKAGKPVEIYGP